MANVIVFVVIAGILAIPVWKIVHDKKRNIRCTSCSACPLNEGCSLEKQK